MAASHRAAPVRRPATAPSPRAQHLSKQMLWYRQFPEFALGFDQTQLVSLGLDDRRMPWTGILPAKAHMYGHVGEAWAERPREHTAASRRREQGQQRQRAHKWASEALPTQPGALAASLLVDERAGPRATRPAPARHFEEENAARVVGEGGERHGSVAALGDALRSIGVSHKAGGSGGGGSGMRRSASRTGHAAAVAMGMAGGVPPPPPPHRLAPSAPSHRSAPTLGGGRVAPNSAKRTSRELKAEEKRLEAFVHGQMRHALAAAPVPTGGPRYGTAGPIGFGKGGIGRQTDASVGTGVGQGRKRYEPKPNADLHQRSASGLERARSGVLFEDVDLFKERAGWGVWGAVNGVDRGVAMPFGGGVGR